MAFASLQDLFRQVSGILQPSHGGTGHARGSEILLARGINSTGSTIARRNIVQYTGGTNTPKVSKVTATSSTHVLGVCYGYYDGQELVVDDCPDGYEMAIQVGGEAEILIETAVTRDEFAYSAATDGQIVSSSSGGTGAFGRIIDSQDTSTGATYCRVMLGLPGSGSAAGGASFGTPALTLTTSNAAGSASTAIRTDASVAIFDATTPVSQAFGDTAATGSAAIAARRDHKHGMPAFATPAIAHGTSANAGVATTAIRSDATLATFDTTVPVTQAFGDAAATGSADRAARRDHVHGMPANPAPSFATPSIALGSSAAGGAASTVIRSDSTIAAFDTTAPVTQAFSDAAATGSAAFAARRDHKHGMPALGTGASDAAAGNHTHGAAGGGVWDTIVVKSADESVTSSTALQDDDELQCSTVSGGYYEFEAHIFHDAGAGASATDIKFSFGEDNTFRGYLFRLAGNSGTGTAEIVAGSVQQNQSLTAQTANGVFGIFVRGSWVSGGSTFKLQWAQNASNGTALKVKAGSTLKVKRLA
jgi:hypothetical protein